MHLWPPDFGLKYWIKKATSWKCSEIVCEFPTGELKKARKSPVGTAALHRRGCRRKLGGWCACFQCTSKVHYCKVQKCINVKFKSALMQSALVYYYKRTEHKSIFPVSVVFRQCSNKNTLHCDAVHFTDIASHDTAGLSSASATTGTAQQSSSGTFSTGTAPRAALHPPSDAPRPSTLPLMHHPQEKMHLSTTRPQSTRHILLPPSKAVYVSLTSFSPQLLWPLWRSALVLLYASGPQQAHPILDPAFRHTPSLPLAGPSL